MSTSAVPDGRFPRLFAEESRSPNLSSVTPGICLLVVAFFLSVPQQSVGQAPPIVPEASSPQQPGTEFRVNVRVGSESENIQNLNQIGFDLSFEQQHLSHVDDEAGSFLGEVQYASNVNSENGTVEVGVTRTDDEGRSGSGVVAQVRLAVGQDVSVGTELTFSVQNVRAEDPNGNSIDLNTQDLDVTVEGENQSPTASFSIDPSVPEVGETVSFNADGSEDPDGTIAEYRWDFDADGDPEATGPTASTSFKSAGENAVTLTVEDNDGSTSEATETVPVNALPVAESDTSQTSDEESVTTDVLANDSDPDGSLDESSVQVESGPSDGTTTVNNDGKITYAPDAGFSGTDSYTYTVADNDGARSSKATVTINVTENVLPMASFGFEPDEPEVGEAVSFDASSSEDPDGSVVEYRWDFDDDGQTEETSQSTTTSFSFTSAGEKPVTLAVEDNEGEIDEITKSVTVVDSPTTQDPVASADTFSTDPDSTLSVEAPGVLQNDSDPDGDSLEASLVTTSSEGDLTLRSDGGFEYDPNPGFVGTDHFRYAASGPEGLSDTSAVQIQVTPPPPTPDSLVAGGGEGRVVLSWVDDDSTGSVAGYNVYRSTSPFSDKGDAALVNEGLVSGSPYTDTTAQRGKTYYYRITAANGSGGESGLSGGAITKTLQEGIAVTVPDLKSDTGEVSTLSVEANLGTAETEGYTNLSFVFDSSVLNIAGVRGGDDLTFGPESPVYNQQGDTLRVSSGSGSPVTGQGELLQIDVELTTDASTTFEAASTNVSRENAVSITPDGKIIPTSVFDDASSSAILLADSTGRGTVSFSEPSGPPDSPAGLTVQLKNGTPNLSWGASESSDVSGYRVYRDTAPIDSSAGPGELAPLDSTEASVTTYADSSGAAGTEYYYRVTAVNAAANESSFSGQVRATPRDTEPPSAPAGLAAQADTTGQSRVSLRWSPPEAADLASHRLYRSTESFVDTSGADRIATLSPTDSVHVDTTATVGETYHYRVAAVDTASNRSGLSNEAVSMPTNEAAPSSPQSLTVVAETGILTLNWSESSSADVNRYRIYRDTAPIASSVGVGGQVPLDSTEASTTSYTDTTATVGTEYYYRVTAVDNASNESDPSNEVSGTPQEADVEEGLIAYYPFSGSAEDVTGNGNSGTVNGATLTTDRSGNTGEAYDFDGEDDYINVPDDAVKTSSGSVCAWFLARSKTDGENDRVFSMSNFTSPGGTRLYLSLASGEEFRAAFISDQLGDVPISFGEWQHTCFTWDDTSSELYLNGNLEDASSGGEPKNGRVNLGSYGEGFKSFLDGKIDQVRIYDRPLSESEVQQLYGKGGGEDDGKYAPGNGYEYLVTERQYDPDDDDISSAIDQEFGEAAELADWNTLKDLYADDKDGLVSFLNGVGMKEGDNAYVQRGGEQYQSGDRHYFIKRHNGDPGDSFLVHDDLHSNTLSLGSWYNPNPALVRLPLEELSPPVNLTANPSDGQVDLSWGIGGDGSPAGYNVYRSPSPFSDISEATKLNDSLIAGTDYADTEVSGGTEYFYRAAAVDTTGNESALSGVASAYLQPEAVEASVARTFGEASGPGDYRLVALPGAPDTSLASAVDGEAGAEWQAYREAGEELRRYQSSAEEDFAFQKGRGYWLTSRQEWALQDSIEAASLQDSTTAIPLNPGGWTIVANPFGEAVPFSALNRANGGDLQALWPFGGAFSDTSAVFKSAREGQAYYLFSEDPGRDSLRVPHPALTDGSGAGSSGKRALQAASGEAKAAAPATIALSARPAGEGEVGPRAASTVRVGIAGERGPGTLRAPPGGLEAVSLRVVRGGQKASGQGEEKRLLMRDRRRTEGEGETFRLRLESQVEGPIRIQARGADSLGSRSAALIDRSEKTTYDLSRDGPIQITPGQEKRRLEVAVGSESYVEGKREKVIPDEVRLTSYPNPAGRRATVEYALPEAREVTLQVYDVLGRRVATLEQGRKKAGRHTARLETGRLSSGVYFGRLEAGEQTRTQKITVVR